MNLDTLEKLADAATPGPWNWYEWETKECAVVEEDGTSITSVRHGGLPDHQFIAAANPATIKSLIALCRMQHGALCAANTNAYFKHAVDALVAFDNFNKGE